MLPLLGLLQWGQDTHKKDAVNNRYPIDLTFLYCQYPRHTNGGFDMSNKESRVILTLAQHEALSYAAKKSGMALATYLRHCALNDATSKGIHAEQPRAD